MFAINHAASALIFKKRLKNEVSMVWILIAVQLIEILWVLLNFLGIEETVTEATVKYVGDIHLSYMPFSHSVLSSLILGILLAGLFFLWKRSWYITFWMTLAFLSHIVLDIFTHAIDIPIEYNYDHVIGMGLYSSAPLIGFFVELAFGLFCWWYYKGSKSLFWIILLFNLANLSMFVPEIKGLEFYLAGKPFLISVVIFIQILLTLYLVGRASKHQNIEAVFNPNKKVDTII